MTNKKILTLISFLLLFSFLMVGCDWIIPNRPPEITSTAVLTATMGVAYTYDVDATDPNPGDVLTYSLIDEPPGMDINPDSGLITWTPDAVGDFDVTVVVSDGKLSVTQDFTITVFELVVELDHIVVLPEAMNLFVRGYETITSVTAHYDDGSTASIALGGCTYLSSDDEVATVLAGKISALTPGTATITVTYGGKTDTLEVTVNSILLTSIVVLPETMTLFDGGSEAIKSVTAHYNDGSTKIVTSDCSYESSDSSIADFVDGKVTAVAYGEATITVSYMEEEITKTVYIEKTDTIEVKVIGKVHNITADRYYDTIKAAVDDAWVEGGDIIEVAAGTYDEQVVINKGLILQGAGDDTIIQPSGVSILATVKTTPWTGISTREMAAIVFVDTAGTQITIKDLKIDSSGITEVPAGFGVDDWVAGLAYLETGGTIDSVTVVGDPSLGCRTCGIWASAITENTFIEVTACSVIGYNRAGIYALGDKMTADYNQNIITGPGGHDIQVPNGMFFMEGATGSATYNTITALEYLGQKWRSSGIGTYNAGADITFGYNTISNVQNAFALAKDTNSTVVEYNDVYDCHTGVKLESGTTNNLIQYNNIYDNDFAIRCGSVVGDGNEAHYNNFVNNSGLEWIFDEETYEGAVCNIHNELVFDARYNWWGDTSGPTYETNPDGTGDTVSDNVIFIPWSPEEN